MKKKIIILFIIVLLGLVIYLLFLKKGNSLNDRISKSLIKSGYVKENEYIYSSGDELSSCDIYSSKENCSVKRFFFSLESYNFYEKKDELLNSVGFEFIPNYDYTKDEYTYTYRVNYQNGVLFFKGKYDMDEKIYTCDLDYQYGIYINDFSSTCLSFKDDLDSFYYDIKTLFKDSNIIKDMKSIMKAN